MNCCSGKISGVTNNINCVPVSLKLKQLNRTQQLKLRFFTPMHVLLEHIKISTVKRACCFFCLINGLKQNILHWYQTGERSYFWEAWAGNVDRFNSLQILTSDTFGKMSRTSRSLIEPSLALSKKTSPGCAAVVRTFQVASFQEICSRQITLGMCPVCGGNHIFLRFQFNFRWFTEQADMNEHPSWQWGDFVVNL